MLTAPFSYVCMHSVRRGGLINYVFLRFWSIMVLVSSRCCYITRSRVDLVVQEYVLNSGDSYRIMQKSVK